MLRIDLFYCHIFLRRIVLVKKELKLDLKKQNYGFNEIDFYKKLNYLINKDYNINIINNNLSPLNYYLGNADNKAVIKLNKFINKNLNY